VSIPDLRPILPNEVGSGRHPVSTIEGEGTHYVIGRGAGWCA